MARKMRIHYPGAFYHVMLRGNSGQEIFFTNQDREYFYSLIEEGIERFNYKIHAFCLMSNHIHLVLQVGITPLSKIVQNFSFRYARNINKSLKRIGHLFQGRHKAILIDADSYLLGLVRYIHLNPVRANMVKQAHDYQWSSHCAYLGLTAYTWLSCDFVLSQLGNDRSSSLANYHKFMNENGKEEIQKAFKIGNQKNFSILGNDQFMEKVNLATHIKIKPELDLKTLTKFICAHYEIDESCLHQPSRKHSYAKIRAKIAWLAQDLKICTLTTVAEYFSRDVSGLIRTIQRLLQNKSACELLRLHQEYIEKSTSQA